MPKKKNFVVYSTSIWYGGIHIDGNRRNDCHFL